MNLFKSHLRILSVCIFGLIITACSKSEANLEEEAVCELYLKGLSTSCVAETCSYRATLEKGDGNGQFDLEIDQATYDHYKAISDEQEANICWEGVIR